MEPEFKWIKTAKGERPNLVSQIQGLYSKFKSSCVSIKPLGVWLVGQDWVLREDFWEGRV
jgi:hypothetical protein